MPWCGTSSSAVDRLPDATSASRSTSPTSAARARPTASPSSRRGSSATSPRSTRWWRPQDPTRAPRFDLFPFPAARPRSDALDISNVQLPRGGHGQIGSAFTTIRLAARRARLQRAREDLPRLLRRPDRPGRRRPRLRPGRAHERLRPPRHRGRLPRLLRRRRGDSLRPVVAVHELVHVFGAVERAAPQLCQSGTSATSRLDLMTASLTGEELEAHVLDAGRNDYYGHSGTLDRRPGLALPRAARLARPDAADRCRRPPRRRRPHRLRARLLASLDRRRRPGRLPHLPGRALRPPGDDDRRCSAAPTRTT